jgi:O-Antigen ligase
MNERAPADPVWRAPSPAATHALFGLLPLMAALGPLLSVYGGLFAFRIACVAIVAYAVVFLLGRSAWSAADRALFLSACAFVIAGLAGLPRVTVTSDNSYSEFLAVALGLVTALATRGWQRRLPGLYLALARGWVGSALLMCALAVVELVTGVHWSGYLESAHPDPAVTFGNPNALAVFAVMANVWSIPVRRGGGQVWRAATWILVPAAALVTVVAQARIALVVLLAVVGWSIWRELRRSRHPLTGVGEALVPVTLSVAVVVLGQRLDGYVLEIGTAGSSGSVRDELVRRGLAIAWDHHGLPTWPGSFEHFMFEAADPVPVAYLVNAHNMWVEILVQYGAVCLLLLLVWVGATLMSGQGARDEIAAAVIALLVLAVVDSSFLDDATLWLFVLTLAAASRVGCPSLADADADASAHLHSRSRHASVVHAQVRAEDRR